MPGFTDANISVTNIQFVATDPDNPTQCSRATFKLLNPSPAVQQEPNGNINVFAKARLIFILEDGFTPLRLKFRETTAKGDPDGAINLIDRRVGPKTAETKDILARGFKNARWQIIIPVKNQKDEVGVVDPEVCNVNEEAGPSKKP